MTRSPGVLRCVLDQGSHVRSMSTLRRCRPGGSAHENASLALLAVLTSTCSSPLVIVLNLARWPDGASSLHLRTELEGQPEKDASYGPDTRRIVSTCSKAPAARFGSSCRDWTPNRARWRWPCCVFRCRAA